MTIDDRTDTHPHTPEEHWCEHPGCVKWGGFGYAPSKVAPMRWYCWPHYPYKEPGSTRPNGKLPK